MYRVNITKLYIHVGVKILRENKLRESIKDVVSCSGFKKSIFFHIFRKYNILRVYCIIFRAKYKIFTKLQHIVENAPTLINSI